MGKARRGHIGLLTDGARASAELACAEFYAEVPMAAQIQIHLGRSAKLF